MKYVAICFKCVFGYTLGMPELIEIIRPDLHLEAVIVLDDETLGPAAGGIRTASYPSFSAAIKDAKALAGKMTLKCALADLDAGGGKAVVRCHEKLDREAAFSIIGEAVAKLNGRFHTAGDLGTTLVDLQIARRYSDFVHLDEGDLCAAVGLGLRACLQANLAQNLNGFSAAVQGVGDIGAAVVRSLRMAGMEVRVCDLDDDKVSEICLETGATKVAVDEILTQDVDVFCPCGPGGVLREDNADSLRAKIVCGGANMPLASLAVEKGLQERGILCLPDVITSAGAVVQGICNSVMNVDSAPLLQKLGETCRLVMQEAESADRLPSQMAQQRANQRLALAFGSN
ncbi:MAG: Glu/Leu/Phe/Val dehydrogenase [Deltaproteobacteria bacterium]|nr:Glu/Leu/Phe/Val dehydrogenase [Deltaproteobacteria bacterium]